MKLEKYILKIFCKREAIPLGTSRVSFFSFKTLFYHKNIMLRSMGLKNFLFKKLVWKIGTEFMENFLKMLNSVFAF